MGRTRRHARSGLDEADDIEAKAAREIGPGVVIRDELDAGERRQGPAPTRAPRFEVGEEPLTIGEDRVAPSLNLRIPAAERGLIDRAAKSSGKTRTDFILSAARRAAEEELLDRTIFVVRPATDAKFLAMLDAPPRPNERLRRTMQATPPWAKA